MPRRNFFEDLIHKIDCENPKAFVLPAEIKGFFKNGQFSSSPRVIWDSS